MRIDRTTVVIAIAAVLLGAAYMGIAAWADARYDDTVPSTSSLSQSALGLKVWREYLRDLGMKPRLLTDFSSLPATGTMVLAGSFENPPSPSDAQRLQAWVSRGGRAVFVGMDDGGLGGPFDPPARSINGSLDSVVRPSFPGAMAYGVDSIAPGTGRFEARTPEWVALYEDDKGACVIARDFGRGTVTWVADITPVSNDGIDDRDNARLAVQIVNTGASPIYFDEYHHGLTKAETAWGSLGAGTRAALLLLLGAVLAFVIARGRRHGPTIPVPEIPAARGSAYIAQLAELFRKAGARGEALARLEDGVVHAIVRRYGDRASGLSRQPGADGALARSAQLRQRGAITKDEFMAVARELRTARKEVEGRNG